jgi:hypothetical protein
MNHRTFLGATAVVSAMVVFPLLSQITSHPDTVANAVASLASSTTEKADLRVHDALFINGIEIINYGPILLRLPK